MTDVFTKRKRSQIMSLVRNKGNRTTELKFRAWLIKSGMSGWKTNDANTFGKPDFVFNKEKIAIFIDGCFWHGCRSCRSIPASNHDFWLEKISRNKRRDRLVKKKLKKDGWFVIRFWEHEVRKNPQKCIGKVKKTILSLQQ